MKYKANRLLLEIGVDSLNKETGRFNFRKFIINRGFKVDQLKAFDAYENNNGWIINFVPSPDNVEKEMLVVFWRGDETVFVENVPSTEGEALGFIEGYGIEDI